jgi:hypothetical protein
VRLLAESVSDKPTSTLRILSFEFVPLHAGCAGLLKSMLRRNPSLDELRLVHCGLDAEGRGAAGSCARGSRRTRACNSFICGTSSFCRWFGRRSERAAGGPGRGPGRPSPRPSKRCGSTPRSLACTWARRGASPTRASSKTCSARTTSRSRGSRWTRPAATARIGSGVVALLRRNRRVRAVHSALLAAHAYRVVRRSVWPPVLHEIVSFRGTWTASRSRWQRHDRTAENPHRRRTD